VTPCPARSGDRPCRRDDPGPRAPPGARSPKDPIDAFQAVMRDHSSQLPDAVLRTPRARRERSPPSPGDRDRRLGPRAIPTLPADIGRPGSPPTVQLRPPPDFDARRFSPRPPAACPVQRADPPGRRRRVRRRRTGHRIRPRGATQVLPVPAKGHLVPRVSDRSGPGHRRPAHRTQDGTLAVTGLRSGPLPARDAGRRRLARGARAGGRSPGPPPSRRWAGASRKPPDGARPGQEDPVPTG
jgi:hypothetical protein